MIENWRIKGELILNCSCTVFCPCVVSLGKHPPTEGHCQGWLGIRIDEGCAGSENLSGLNVALLLDIPGDMGRGNWTVAAYIDERASEQAFARLVEILSGKAKGTTGLFALLVGNFLGAERAPVLFETSGRRRRLTVPKRIVGELEPIEGKRPGEDVMVSNTGYWMGSEVTIAKAIRGRVRAFGRVWDFDGRSGEICQIDWKGPAA
jgi:hypothetical protein